MTGIRPNGVRSRVARSWRRLTGAAAVSALAFGLIAGGCCLVAVAGPRASAALRTTAFRQTVAAAPALDKAVVGTIDDDSLATALGGSLDAAQLAHLQRQLRENVSRFLPQASPASDWAGITTPFAGFADHSPEVSAGQGTQLELSYRGDLSAQARLVAGALPASPSAAGRQDVVPVAVTAATAARFSLRVGSRLALPGSTGISVVVSGIVAPKAPGSPFWQLDSIVTAPVLVTPADGAPYWQGGAFVAASALPVLSGRFSPPLIQVTWMLGLALSRLSPARAAVLAGSLPARLNQAGELEFASSQTVAAIGLSTGILPVLTQFASQESGVSDVLDLMSVSLAAVGAAVVLLAAWLMAAQRREEFAVLRARGASRWHLAAASLTGSAVAAVPGATLGIAAGVLLTPGPAAPLAWWLAGLTIAAALAGPVLITVRMQRGYAVPGRPDRPPRRIGAARRAVAEFALAAGSVGGLLVLRHQGAGPGGGLYASAAPILLAVPVAIVAIRVYPLALRPLLAIVSRRPGVTGFLGLARAARVSATTVLPVFAMVLALSLVSFAGMVRGAVSRGEVAASWQESGADAVVAVPGVLSRAQQRAVAAVPGVRRTAAFGLMTGTVGYASGGLTTLIADPAQYAALLADEPTAPAPASFTTWTARAAPGPVPVLASPAMAAELGHRAVPLDLTDGPRVVVRVAGVVPAASQVNAIGAESAAGYLVLPRAAVGTDAPAPSIMLLTGSDIDGGALTALARRWAHAGATVVLRGQLLAALQRAALQHDAYVELALGGVAAGIGCLLVLLLTLLLSASSRELTLARGAAMGLSPGQGRSLAVIELLPQLAAVLIGGLACGLALAPLLGPALSLSVFTGSSAGVRLQIEPLWLTATAIVLVVLAVATLTGQMALASRRTPRSLRIGG